MEGDQTKNPKSAAVPNSASVQAANPSAQPTAPSPQAPTPVQPAPQAPLGQSNQVAYKSSDIGVKTAVKEDPFAPQNQRTAAKKQQAKKERKKFYLIGGIIVAVAIVALAIWGIVVIFTSNNEQKTPEVVEDNNVTEEEITNLNTGATDLGQAAQVAFSESGDNMEAADQVFDQAIKEAQAAVENNDNAETRYYANQVAMQKMGFYVNQGFYNDAIALGEALDAESMVPEQRSSLYMILASCYAYNGDEEKGMEYQNKAYQASLEMGGGISGE